MNPLIVFFLVTIILVVARLLLIGLSRLAGSSSGEGSDILGLGSASKVAAVVALLVFGLCLFAYVSEQQGRKARRRWSEPKSNLGAIRSTEVAYCAEWTTWVGNQPPTPVVDRRGNNSKVTWDPNTRFSILGFAPEGEVWCSYSLEGPDWPAEHVGFTARADCDFNNDGQTRTYWITNRDTEIRMVRGLSPGDPLPAPARKEPTGRANSETRRKSTDAVATTAGTLPTAKNVVGDPREIASLVATVGRGKGSEEAVSDLTRNAFRPRQESISVAPKLALKGTEEYEVRGKVLTRYRLTVENHAIFANEMFRAAPDLPPCGTNKNSARTWVDIMSSDGKYLYGFCAFNSAQNLTQLWFAIAKGSEPPEGVFVLLNDREKGVKHKSNTVVIKTQN